MDPFERELRTAFGRRDPPVDFTDRLMDRVRSAPTPTARPRSRRWQWAAAGAMAASLLTGAFVGSERTERRAAEQAERAELELIEALSLAGSKINDARTKVWEVSARERNP